MSSYAKWFGPLSLLIGAVLNTVRMIPIYMDVGFDGYPPKSLAETIEIGQLTGYYISHIMALIAAPFFVLGFYAVCRRIDPKALNPGVLLAFLVFFMGQILYVSGVVVHGLVLPAMATEYVAATASVRDAMAPLFELQHKLATSFGGLGLAHLLIATGILGLFLKDEFKLLGYFGSAIGILAVIGYTSGMLDLMLFGSFVATAGLATAMFAFYLILAFRTLKESQDT